MKSSITIEDLLQELHAARQDDEGMTVEEWVDATGLPAYRVRAAIKAGLKRGRMASGYAERVAMNGHRRRSVVYRMVTPTGKRRA